MKYIKHSYLIFIMLMTLLSCKESVQTPTVAAPAATNTGGSLPIPSTASLPPPAKKEKFSLIHKVRQPTIETGRTTPVLILLHGLGSNEEDLFKFAEGVDGRFMVISARAPLQIGIDQYSWYKLKKDKAGDFTYSELDISVATRQVKQFVSEVKKHYPVDPFKVYVGGFSQGAILSLGTGLKYPLDIRGVLCLSGELYPEFEKNLDSVMAKRGMDIFVSHGKKDAVLSYEKMKKSVNLLKSHDYRVIEHYYDTQHTISQQNYKDMLKWLKERP